MTDWVRPGWAVFCSHFLILLLTGWHLVTTSCPHPSPRKSIAEELSASRCEGLWKLHWQTIRSWLMPCSCQLTVTLCVPQHELLPCALWLGGYEAGSVPADPEAVLNLSLSSSGVTGLWLTPWVAPVATLWHSSVPTTGSSSCPLHFFLSSLCFRPKQFPW
jgi:hypothetical protein